MHVSQGTIEQQGNAPLESIVYMLLSEAHACCKATRYAIHIQGFETGQTPEGPGAAESAEAGWGSAAGAEPAPTLEVLMEPKPAEAGWGTAAGAKLAPNKPPPGLAIEAAAELAEG